MNAVVLAVVLMMILALLRINVVLSLAIAAFIGGLYAGLPLSTVTDSAGNIQLGVMELFQNGLAGGAQIALSYAMLGAFAMAIMHSGLPQQLAHLVIRKMEQERGSRSTLNLKWLLMAGLLAMSVMSQNLIPIHIAFIPMLVPPLMMVFNQLQIDRRLLACVMTFGLVTTYMFLPYGFGEIFLKQILLGNAAKFGLDTQGLNVVTAMAIPALGMFAGLLIAAFFSYRKARHYQSREVQQQQHSTAIAPSTYRSAVAIAAIIVAFVIQLFVDNALLLSAMLGFAVLMLAGVVKRRDADSVFDSGIRMMAMIGFIMIAAKGFAEVMNATGQIDSLVSGAMELFGNNRVLAAAAMLLVGLLVTMGIGSSFSTLPILAAIYVPLCMEMGFSALATIAIIGTAGALGDAGSPASDSTLGPTVGLNGDGQHNHIRDTVIPTFLHFNIPLFIAGWIAALIL